MDEWLTIGGDLVIFHLGHEGMNRMIQKMELGRRNLAGGKGAKFSSVLKQR